MCVIVMRTDFLLKIHFSYKNSVFLEACDVGLLIDTMLTISEHWRNEQEILFK